jgi:protein-disulfide isomerase
VGSNLASAELPRLRPDDHVRGNGPEAIVYLDLACPYCAAKWVRIRDLPLRLVVRHFPVSSKHPRAPALHAAAEAAWLQGGFWDMCDSLLTDRAHQDDPHLWERARRFGLDLERFERDRRSDAIAGRVRRDFEDGIRAGVASTPAAFAVGRRIEGEIDFALASLTSSAIQTEDN